MPAGAIAVDTDRAPVTWPGRPVGLIAGPPGSGRSNALTAVGLAHDGPVALVSDKTPPHALPTFAPDDPAALAGWSLDHPDGLLLIDDLDQCADTAIAEIATVHLHGSSAGGVIGAGTAANLTGGFRGLIGDLRRPGTGILLLL